MNPVSRSINLLMAKVVSYGLGGHYEPHHDYFGSMTHFDPANSKVLSLVLHQFLVLQNLNVTAVRQVGDRAATLLFFLSTPDAGGATVFPLLGISVTALTKFCLTHHLTHGIIGGTCGRGRSPVDQPWSRWLGTFSLPPLRLPCPQRFQKGWSSLSSVQN